MFRNAIISEDGLYRYRLDRSWADLRSVTFLMFNPSTADASVDDPTIRKCIGFARVWGYGSIVVVNLFALRATNPREIGRSEFSVAVGPENDYRIMESLVTAERLICAWGCSTHMKTRLDRPRNILRTVHEVYPLLPVMCLGKSADGSPRHPLMLAYSTAMEPYRVRGAA